MSGVKEPARDRQSAVLSREVDQRSVVRGSKWREVTVVAWGSRVLEMEEAVRVGEAEEVDPAGL